MKLKRLRKATTAKQLHGWRWVFWGRRLLGRDLPKRGYLVATSRKLAMAWGENDLQSIRISVKSPT